MSSTKSSIVSNWPSIEATQKFLRRCLAHAGPIIPKGQILRCQLARCCLAAIPLTDDQNLVPPCHSDYHFDWMIEEVNDS